MASTDDARIAVERGTTWRDLLAARRVRAGIAVLLIAAVALTLYLVRRPSAPTWPVPHADASVQGTPVTVGTDVCGAGWTGGRAGRQTFALWNNSIGGEEVYLRDAASQKVYLEVENLGAGVTRSASTTLAPGTYQFYCLPDDGDPVAGPAHGVIGAAPAAATPGLVPVSSAELVPATQAYTAWIQTRLPVLHRQVGALAADIGRGDLGAARKDWLAGHRTYETLGAAYDAFGTYDAAINGDHAGFHQIEALLWGGAPAARITQPAAALVRAVQRLQRAFPTVADQMGTQAIGLRSHEILENAVQFELTGSTDRGSHTNLATVDANLTGTRQALKPLRPLLGQRDPDLAVTDRWLQRSQALVRSFDHGGTWTPLGRLTRAQHEEIDADLEQTVEYLSEVAAITEPRRTDQ
ncbi:EfeM/EfeO family lipoprotein [Nocardioides sp. BP30]|uniref:EfeM/EfeO family lipoprotein n=1 Tax=Nocardioides sp. BP30 TaxID=3036374 RepID=UPI0024693FDE|nr:EfeM/EfeO family lipoprotein [Nocardioides sp. BP30]WGL51161.1 EfeM/EfeO family lipoprotein [Nocardioides sp. BP30]